MQKKITPLFLTIILSQALLWSILHAHLNNTQLHEQSKQHSISIAKYKQALEADPSNVNLMVKLCIEQSKVGNYDEALALLNKALQFFPNDLNLLRNKGFILKKIGNYNDAITCYKKILQMKPHDPQTQRALSHAYLALGNFTNGLPAYEYRWLNPPAYVDQLKTYLQSNTTLDGKTVLIKTEYGLGDSMQFIRYAQLLKKLNATVIVESQKPLVPLFSLCPYIDSVLPAGSPLITTDFTCLVMSLPLVFNTKLETIPHKVPYLYADKKLLKFWKKEIDSETFSIGICWQADRHTGSDHQEVKTDAQKKSIPLELLAQLSTIPNVKLYSLQKINGLKQLEDLLPEYQIHDFGPHFDQANGPFMDTAAIMKHLDLVITIDTSVAHLAGGLGVPVWVILPKPADWRWLIERNDSPWYPTMKLFRQPQTGDWQSVIEKLKEELHKQLER